MEISTKVTLAHEYFPVKYERNLKTHNVSICFMLWPFTPIFNPTRSLWSWFVIYFTKAFDWIIQMYITNNLKTFHFDLWLWGLTLPLGLKINRVIALHLRNLTTKYEQNRAPHYWVIMLTEGQTDKYDKVKTSLRFAFSYIINQGHFQLCKMYVDFAHLS